MARETFSIIAATKLSDNKEMVASKNSKNEIVMATRAVVLEGGKEKYYYDKGAIIVENKHVSDFKKFLEKISSSIE